MAAPLIIWGGVELGKLAVAGIVAGTGAVVAWFASGEAEAFGHTIRRGFRCNQDPDCDPAARRYISNYVAAANRTLAAEILAINHYRALERAATALFRGTPPQPIPPQPDASPIPDLQPSPSSSPSPPAFPWGEAMLGAAIAITDIIADGMTTSPSDLSDFPFYPTYPTEEIQCLQPPPVLENRPCLDAEEAERLKKELTERAKYYFKNFGAAIAAVMAGLDTVATGGARTSERLDYIRDQMKLLLQLYEKISNDELARHPDCDLLSQIKPLLPQLAKEVERILAGEVTTLDSLMALIIRIGDLGDDYRDRLLQLLERIRTCPGHARYTHGGDDIDGQYWQQLF